MFIQLLPKHRIRVGYSVGGVRFVWSEQWQRTGWMWNIFRSLMLGSESCCLPFNGLSAVDCKARGVMGWLACLVWLGQCWTDLMTHSALGLSSRRALMYVSSSRHLSSRQTHQHTHIRQQHILCVLERCFCTRLKYLLKEFKTLIRCYLIVWQVLRKACWPTQWKHLKSHLAVISFLCSVWSECMAFATINS